MSTLSLYIWEGHGISSGLQNAGTLVVLAHSAAEAREIVRARRTQLRAEEETWNATLWEKMQALKTVKEKNGFYSSKDYQELARWRPTQIPEEIFDGGERALDREPDRVLAADEAQWVAFNVGNDGYN